MKILLCDNWKSYEKNTNDVMQVNIPTCNYLDLLENKKIEDPYLKDNEEKTFYLQDKDWVYERDFSLNEKQLKSHSIKLVFEQLDTIATVYLNGEKIYFADNCHIKHIIDIKGIVKENNNLKIEFTSPVNYVKEKQNAIACPANANGLDGIVHIRKPQCHFGWDWGPNLPISGITKEVYLDFDDYAKLKDFNVISAINKDNATITIIPDIEIFKEKEFDVEVKITTPSKIEYTSTKKYIEGLVFDITVDDVHLWWPNGMSDNKLQPLYDVEVSISLSQDKIKKQVGLRDLTLNQEQDEYGTNFQFIVNGKKVFAKGANWIPLDSLITRADKKVIEEYVKIAYESNFNMIRVWGGGYYESDYFYELCDKYGILVWQDFCFACQAYPLFIEELKQNTFKEVEYNVKRLRHHASLALWCGNNEIEVMSIAWIMKKKFIDITEEYFYKQLPQKLREFDYITPYIPGTPIGSSYNKEVSSDNVGDTHLWAVWHGLQDLKYYRKRPTRFCSEFGFESLPDIKAIETFADRKDYDLHSKVFNVHQKCASGNDKMQYYIASRFRLPKNFIDYVYLSQICQSESIKDATEYWHRNMGRCNGSLYWQYNDCWPVCSWAGMDYYRNYKALQYEAKDFFAPLSVSIEDSKESMSVYVINDTIYKKSVKLINRIVDFDGNEVLKEEMDLSIDETSSNKIKEYSNNLKNKKNLVFIASLYEDGKLINEKTCLYDLEKKINLPKSHISVDISVEEDEVIYKIKSDKYVRKLMLHQKAINAPFEDNFMDLIANEEIIVKQKRQNKSLQEIKEGFSMFNLSQVEIKQPKFLDSLIRLKVLLQPVNFGSYIYYKHLI